MYHARTLVSSVRRSPLGRFAALLASALVLQLSITAAAQDLTTSPPPEPYVNAATILPLPEFIPGAGALFIDPANAPVGPWLAYGSNGELVEVLFMVPVSGMQAAENWADLAAGLLAELGMTIDHVDVTYNGGHPGMAEPHYHIRLSLLDHAAQEAALSQAEASAHTSDHY
jgi:hypothetical protein